ncbi:LysM peptidoglycan-binding domain-containing protein [Paenibacillus sp. MWE-103]|uniref:LysM peptidoglycan-binding domain-containing protein n=1 Tax=Paenibacillus artemisiicola TaxID=1172618 RepID=A0ABS3WA95_9BACL|nr:LysM peptidoglycan-binding domain-containing protein [Paenibacillus artemisiicola]MBO7745076.1 LysM peptidoglycan-binding domain-containing protein [Paenibacillus artemisiicola]
MSRQTKWFLSMVMAVALLAGYHPGMSNAGGSEESFISIAYGVKPGDTLYGIAKRFYLTGDYVRVAKLNGLDPKAGLKAGTTVRLRNPLVLAQYTVQPGDTLFAITNKYYNRNQYLNALMTYNGITDPNTGLKLGMALRVPLPSGEGRHKVARGDTLYSLASRYFKASDYRQAIAQANGLPADGAVKAGQALRIPNPYDYKAAGSPAVAAPAAGTPSAKVYAIEIDVTRNKLYVLAGGKVERSFAIASGRDGLTPIGSYEIITKIKNPWYSAKGIPGGDPKNPLGSRWLGLDVPNTQGTTYGIHGTNAPASIGTNASAGCIRMHNEDVEWLFDRIPTGTKVKLHA